MRPATPFPGASCMVTALLLLAGAAVGLQTSKLLRGSNTEAVRADASVTQDDGKSSSKPLGRGVINAEVELRINSLAATSGQLKRIREAELVPHQKRLAVRLSECKDALQARGVLVQIKPDGPIHYHELPQGSDWRGVHFFKRELEKTASQLDEVETRLFEVSARLLQTSELLTQLKTSADLQLSRNLEDEIRREIRVVESLLALDDWDHNEP